MVAIRVLWFFVTVEGVRASSGGNGGGSGGSGGNCGDEFQAQCHVHEDETSVLQVRAAMPLVQTLVLPPGGASCSSCLPNGSIVSMHSSKVSHATMPNGTRIEGGMAQKLTGGMGSWVGGWRTYAETAKYADPITWFSAEFEVPEEPKATDSSKTITYIFPGLEDVDHDWILQPVLQWGSAACGPHPPKQDQWTYQSYMVPKGPSVGCSHASSYLPVKVGQKLRGEMELMQDGRWRVTSTVADTGASTTLLIAGAKPQRVPVLTIELDSATTPSTVCDAYPQSPVTFSKVHLKTTAGPIPSSNVQWQKKEDSECSGHVRISNHGDVTLSSGAAR
uniref:Uncharacterized protein n=1 Tax=Zooxanthella nutricula TaxID=1333877 RepID=A0A6U6QJ64_9DINO